MLVFNGYMSMGNYEGNAIFLAVGLNKAYYAGRFRCLHLSFNNYYNSSTFESFLGGNYSFSASSACIEKLTAFLSSSCIISSLFLKELSLYFSTLFSPLFRSLFRICLSQTSFSSRNLYLSASFYFISYYYFDSYVLILPAVSTLSKKGKLQYSISIIILSFFFFLICSYIPSLTPIRHYVAICCYYYISYNSLRYTKSL